MENFEGSRRNDWLGDDYNCHSLLGTVNLKVLKISTWVYLN